MEKTCIIITKIFIFSKKITSFIKQRWRNVIMIILSVQRLKVKVIYVPSPAATEYFKIQAYITRMSRFIIWLVGRKMIVNDVFHVTSAINHMITQKHWMVIDIQSTIHIIKVIPVLNQCVRSYPRPGQLWMLTCWHIQRYVHINASSVARRTNKRQHCMITWSVFMKKRKISNALLMVVINHFISNTIYWRMFGGILERNHINVNNADFELLLRVG